MPISLVKLDAGRASVPASRVTDAAVPLDLAASFSSERAKLLSYMGRRAGRDAAADLVQEVFVRASGSEQAASLANPAAFLKRIARNILIDRTRRRAANDVTFVPIEDHRHAACAPQQEWNLEAADLLRLYQAAIDSLPEKTRRVFLMHRVEELTYREIHQQLGISIATVEYHMMKALAHVARSVEAGR